MSDKITLFTKELLIEKFREIRDRGWIENKRGRNDGAVGNTLEDLLGIAENNLPIPNASEWELKAQRAETTSLLTLFHMEPSPRAAKLVPNLLLPKYGWEHQQAGTKYPVTEMSFRSTISGKDFSDRGFIVVVNRQEERVEVRFDSTKCDDRHKDWLNSVKQRAGLGNLSPIPYWGFSDLFSKARTKLLNCFYVQAETKKDAGKEFFRYSDVFMLKDIEREKFLAAIEAGKIYVDFDARTGHNHGTKFRIKFSDIPSVYSVVLKVL